MLKIVTQIQEDIKETYPDVRLYSSHKIDQDKWTIYYIGDINKTDLERFRKIYPLVNIEKGVI